MYALLDSRASWYDELSMNEDVREEFSFWPNCLTLFNCQKVWKAPSVVRVVYSDISTSFGGFTMEDGSHIAHGQWTEAERGKSSPWRE